jgi:hypothetical protein
MKVMMKLWLLRSLIFWTAVSLIACNAGSGKDKYISQGVNAAFIVTTDFQSGSYATVDLLDHTVNKNIKTINQDAVCRYDPITGLPFVIGRGADAIDVIDPSDGWQLVREYSVGPGLNPQDIAVFSPQRAYVARLKDPGLLVVHPTLGTVVDTIDLSSYADSDGIPEVTWVGQLNGKIYATLARLDGYTPTDYSLMLVIDGATGKVEEAVKLTWTNPSGKMRYNKNIEQFVLIESGGFSSLNDDQPLDGGIEFFNPVDNTISGLVISAKELGGDIIDAVIVSHTKGFAIIEKGKGDDVFTALVSFDPSMGKKNKDIIAAPKWVYVGLELSPDGTEVWMADQTRTAPGIRIFSAITDEEITTEPIDVGLRPFMICFVVDGGSSGLDGGSYEDGGFSEGGVDDDGGRDSDAGLYGEYADEIVEAPGDQGEDTYDALNAVDGVRSGETGVFSIGYEAGVNNYVTVRWSERVVVDGPGTDFVLFENGFSIDEENVFMDQAVVFLSRDGVSWVPFPHDYVALDETEYSSRPDDWIGFGGVQPVRLHEENNPVHPFDNVAAGGDHFDMADLLDDPESAAIKAKGFTFLKIVSAATIVNSDTGETFVRSEISNGPDIDGVYARYFVDEH